jgi:hypothetical protein
MLREAERISIGPRVGRYGLELSATPIDIIMAREARRMSIG